VTHAANDPSRPTRVLIVLPSWIGDAVMATPALELIRRRMPGAFIGVLAKPGVDAILEGLDLFDELHLMRDTGMMTTKHAAAKVRPRQYHAALLLTNSFSTALVTRLAGIPRRIGYDRDGRGFLLTERLIAPKRSAPPAGLDPATLGARGKWAVTPAVNYYWHAALHLVEPPAHTGHAHPPLRTDLDHAAPDRAPLILPPEARMTLAVTEADETRAAQVLASASVAPGAPLAVLNPGGNNPAKRWPPERFAQLAYHLATAHTMTVLLNGSPTERDLLDDIANRAAALAPDAPRPVVLSDHGGTLGSLKAILRHARLLVTNDTGPRHIGVAMATPTVTIFGPTDARWTTIPTETTPGPESKQSQEIILVAAPDLPQGVIANDVPDRCRVDAIGFETVKAACDQLIPGSHSTR
jgi:heptosyltransferase-2